MAQIVESAMDSTVLPKNFIRERQIIPLGYAGRVDAVETPLKASSALNGQTVTIKLNPAFEEATDLLKQLERAADRAGVKLTFKFQSYLDKDTEQNHLAQMISFAGNQKDAIGTWSFLFSEEHGPLRQFRNQAEDYLKRALGSSDAGARANILKELHTFCLTESYLIPLMAEPLRIFASDRVDLSRINRFDMRLRLYEIRWR